MKCDLLERQAAIGAHLLFGVNVLVHQGAPLSLCRAISIFQHAIPAPRGRSLRFRILGCGAVTERYQLPSLQAGPDIELAGFAAR